jgi:hypothetical protein
MHLSFLETSEMSLLELNVVVAGLTLVPVVIWLAASSIFMDSLKRLDLFHHILQELCSVLFIRQLTRDL